MQYLDDYFDRIVSIDGNDPRGIDVGLLIRKDLKAQVTGIRSHVDEGEGGKSVIRRAQRKFGYMAQNAVFSRDCLEVDLTLGGKTLTFLVNHLKAQDNTDASVKRRTRQSERVAQLVSDSVKAGRLPVVLGDLNVAPKTDKSLKALLTHKDLKDPFDNNTWTHYYSGDKTVSRLDYILPHKSLKVSDIAILRKGLTKKCKQYTGDRYPTVGVEHTEASDHCPVTLELKL